MSKKLFWSIIVIFILILGLILAVYLVRRRTQITGKAYGPVSGDEVGLENSYIFASPLTARVGGERIRITVFVLNHQGKGVLGKRVVLGNNEIVKVLPIQAVTDDLGRTLFDVSSMNPGSLFIAALVENKLLPQKV